MERDIALEDRLQRAWGRLIQQETEARQEQEDFFNPLIDAALAENDDDAAVALAKCIPDVVTYAFAMDRIREWRKQQG